MNRKFKIGDVLVRNDKHLNHSYETDPKTIKIIDYALLSKGDCCDGYKMLDLTTGKKEKDTYSEEFVLHYYNDILIQRKNKLKKLNHLYGI
jgi:hypothetical protein